MRPYSGSKNDIFRKLKNQIIVSCQALEDEPLYGSDFMVKMAIAAELGGASGIRANSVRDVKAIKHNVCLPVIGIIKRQYKGNECYITPAMKEVDELMTRAQPHIIAVDGTGRVHPDNITGSEFITAIKLKYPDIFLMADISTPEEGLAAEEAGADMVSTTLSGYTSYSPQVTETDFKLMEELSHRLNIPVIGEGRIWCPEEARRAFQLGVHTVVVGTAITRPMEITKRFVNYIKNDAIECCPSCCKALCS